MIDKKTLREIKKAARNVKTENDTFYVAGDCFSCRWNGSGFDWTVDGRTYKNCTAKEVIEWIGDGRHVTNYCYDYCNY